MENLTDRELEDIIRRAENIHRSGSRHEKAQIELDIRRKRKLYELQENIYSTIKSRLDRIIKLLEFISKKPLKSLLIAATIAIGIGVLINVISKALIALFN